MLVFQNWLKLCKFLSFPSQLLRYTCPSFHTEPDRLHHPDSRFILDRKIFLLRCALPLLSINVKIARWLSSARNCVSHSLFQDRTITPPSLSSQRISRLYKTGQRQSESILQRQIILMQWTHSSSSSMAASHPVMRPRPSQKHTAVTSRSL
jgi:hypothetical protein